MRLLLYTSQLMKDNKREENIYESLASFLDDRSTTPDKTPTSSEEKERRKLMFLWDECHPEKVETEDIWKKTMQKIANNDSTIAKPTHRRFMSAWLWGAAASVVILIGLGFFFSRNNIKEEVDEALKMEQYMLANTSAEDVKEVTLVVSDKKKIEIANNSQVAYTSTGQVRVNSNKLDETKTEDKAQVQEEEYNQIIVPKGRRSMIVLADNSKIWINSGSKVIYPRSFKNEKRQIYVEGEVYLKVTHDETKPFIVSTSACEVEVLGTSFNVSAYKGNTQADIVLVEGSVNVRDNLKRLMKMQPNERVELNEAGIAKKEKVNALEYIQWVDGIWALNGKPLKEVLRYLSEYYGQTILCDPLVEAEPFYGKLFLNEDLNKILESIRQALPEELALKKNIIYLDNSIQ